MFVDKNKIFNLWDTNGRRRDIVNAVYTYLVALESVSHDCHQNWRPLPDSFFQYKFFFEAYDNSDGVLNYKKESLDVKNEVERNIELRKAFNSSDLNGIALSRGFLKKIDKHVESISRHLTNSLVKLGFTDKDRNISEVGELVLGKRSVKRDLIEQLIPISDSNLIYFRQLLKLKVFSKTDSAKSISYSPFLLSIYALLKKERITKEVFSRLIESRSPYLLPQNIDSIIEKMTESESSSIKYLKEEIKDNFDSLGDLLISKEDFIKYFYNGKSASISEQVYYPFYRALFELEKCQTEHLYVPLKKYCELLSSEDRKKIDKAFFYKENAFFNLLKKSKNFSEFEKNCLNKYFVNGFSNDELYKNFRVSKVIDNIREYSDTLVRLLDATSIIKFDKGYAELLDRELCSQLFDEQSIKDRIFQNEKDPYYYDNAVFLKDISLSEILGYDDKKQQEIVSRILSTNNCSSKEEFVKYVNSKKSQEFNQFVETKFPLKTVIEILQLFSDRKNNDSHIQKLVTDSASIPTIYEYLIGILWFYFSGKTINIHDSFNLHLSSGFLPLTHAPGGKGDIVIYEGKRVTMLEVTLMDRSSQKRGEWEPVLRHATNLQVEIDKNSSNLPVTTFFISEEFDKNTINIWKAVSSVPLFSSDTDEQAKNSVIIMPITSSEIISLIDKNTSYEKFIDIIRSNFTSEIEKFDLKWREKIIGNF